MYGWVTEDRLDIFTLEGRELVEVLLVLSVQGRKSFSFTRSLSYNKQCVEHIKKIGTNKT